MVDSLNYIEKVKKQLWKSFKIRTIRRFKSLRTMVPTIIIL
jgi:hypothetical protein